MYRSAGNNYNVNFRSNYGNTLAVPPTSGNSIIFPYNNISNKFEASHYLSTMTQSRIPLSDITLVLSEIETIIKEYKDYSNPRKLLVLFFVCFLIILNSLIIESIFDLTNVFYFTLLATAIFAVLYISIYFRNSVKLLEKARQKTVEFLSTKSRHFEENGLKWVIPFQFPNWMELWKNEEMSTLGDVDDVDMA